MTRFEIIPFVFELARIQTGRENDKKFCMKYEDYPKYLQMYDEMDDESRMRLIDKVKSKKKSFVR